MVSAAPAIGEKSHHLYVLVLRTLKNVRFFYILTERNKVMENLTICELESFIRLCDRKKEIMYRKISAGNGNRAMNEDYNSLFRIADKLDEEFNKRLLALKEDV